MAGKVTGKAAVQVQLQSAHPYSMPEDGMFRNLMTWVPTELKPKVGQVITAPPDKTEWTIVWAGTLVNHFEGLPSWR